MKEPDGLLSSASPKSADANPELKPPGAKEKLWNSSLLMPSDVFKHCMVMF